MLLIVAMAIGMLDEQGFQAVLNLRPVFLLQQSRFEVAEFTFGSAYDVKGFAFAQEGDVGLTHHDAVHHPDSLDGSVFFFHHFDDLFDRGHVDPVAGEDFVGKRQPLIPTNPSSALHARFCNPSFAAPPNRLRPAIAKYFSQVTKLRNLG